MGDDEMARPAAVGRTTCEEPAEANKPETPHAPPRAAPRCDQSTSRGNQALGPERSLREIGKRPQQQELAVHVKSIATCIPGNRQDEAEKPINAPGRKGHYNESGRGIPRIIKIQWGRGVDSKGAGTLNWVGLGRLDRDGRSRDKGTGRTGQGTGTKQSDLDFYVNVADRPRVWC
jgi:hypothetical protein